MRLTVPLLSREELAEIRIAYLEARPGLHGHVSVELRVPGGRGRSLGDYPRAWPDALARADFEPFR